MKRSPGFGTTGPVSEYVPDARQNAVAGGALPTRARRSTPGATATAPLGQAADAACAAAPQPNGDRASPARTAVITRRIGTPRTECRRDYASSERFGNPAAGGQASLDGPWLCDAQVS